ncbi:hypothetical protein [Streptomyces sp. NPDC002078]
MPDDTQEQRQPTAERYAQWWAGQRQQYCPGDYAGADRQARLRRLDNVEREMATTVAGLVGIDRQVERWDNIPDATGPRQSMARWAETRLADHQRMALEWLKLLEDQERLNIQYPPEQAAAFYHAVFNDPANLPITTRITNRLRRLFH